MRKWFNWYIVLVVVGCMLLLIFPFYGHADTDPRIPRNKVVLLVYDDSGSMWEAFDQIGQERPIDNWKYANYALQSFAALLDDNDQLKVVYMSSPFHAKQVELDPRLRQLGIDQIRSWEGKSATPLSSVHTAIAELEKAAEEYNQSYFWLVVLTDGVFNELNYSDQENTKEEIDKSKEHLFGRLKELKNLIEAKGAKLQTALIPTEQYLNPDEAIMMADFKRKWMESIDGDVMESNGQVEIIDRINEVAALMTNRDTSDADQFQLNPVIEGNQLFLQSPFPLRRITIIVQSIDQNASFKMMAFNINDKNVEKGIEGPYVIETPIDTYKLNPPIKGVLTHLKNVNGDSIIEHGTYSIEFEEPITDEQKENMKILAEPAIDFTFDFKKKNPDGSLTDDKAMFFAGSEMVLETTLVKSVTEEEEIDIRNIDVDSLFEVVATVGEEEIKLTYDKADNKFKGHFSLIEKEDIPVKVLVKIKGFYQKEKETTINGYPIRKLELLPASHDWSAKLDDLKTADPLVLTPLIDGNEMSEEELSEIFQSFSISAKASRIDFEIQQEANKILIFPKGKIPLFMTSVGEISIEVKLTGKYPNEQAETSVQINIEDISLFKKYGSWLLSVFALILLAIYLVGILMKPRFDKNRISVLYKRGRTSELRKLKNKNGSTEHFHGSFFKKYFVPYVREKKVINDLLFRAHAKKDRVWLAKECQEPGMIVRHEKLDDLSGKEDILIFNNDEVQITRGNYSSIYIFKSRF